MKVLIVDDSALIRKNLIDILLKNSYSFKNIIEARDGDEGIEKYRKHKPDVVILDINMPKIKGIEVLQNIKSFDKDANVIILSAINQKNVIMDALKFGAVDYVNKPLKEEKLIKVMNKIDNKKIKKAIEIKQQNSKFDIFIDSELKYEDLVCFENFLNSLEYIVDSRVFVKFQNNNKRVKNSRKEKILSIIQNHKEKGINIHVN